MTQLEEVEELRWLREDLAYHQARVLLLTAAVAAAPGHQRKLDGLTKLAKLDFLVRYPALAPVILDALPWDDERLHLTDRERIDPTDVEAPMVRYKYGPWDDRYHPVIGALVSRGLLRYLAGRKGSVALAPTKLGRSLAAELLSSEEWHDVALRCQAIAEASPNKSGAELKDLIYERLSDLMQTPQRRVIR
ncbi:hypothetical protein AB0E63_44515 [Kribbella sp. NPDC026596]|uniref:hypothetical protein n=1 Tax=Kribbella sp. NPDC026596 TaxID=3155122 RepID=UPI0033F1D1F3